MDYTITYPVFEVKKTPLLGDPHTYLENVLSHIFYEVKSFDFFQALPKVATYAGASEALKEALKTPIHGQGFYYCLIRNATIISMQYVRDINQIRFVED
jgi:hypothetical protein